MLRKGTFILMKTKIQDMTSGSPGRLIILFAIPLMLGNICQQLYTMVDTMVVGQIFEILCPIILGELNRKSLSESCGYSCDNPHQKVNSTQCGKSLHTCNLANNHGIHHCIKLLTDISQHQGIFE